MNPTVFYLYMDNPPLLDLLIHAALELEAVRMLKSTLQELSAVGVYTKLDCELDRFALWLVDIDSVSVARMGARPTLNRDLNPVAASNPTTILGVLKALEVCVAHSTLNVDIKTKMVKQYALLFPLFNQTLLQ